MKRNVIHFIFVLLLTLVHFTGASASEKTRLAISEFQGGIPQKVILTELLISFARTHTQKYQIVTADSSIKSAISRYRSEMETGINPQQNALNLEKVSAEWVLVPTADRFGDMYVLTAKILDLTTFATINQYVVIKKGNSEVLLYLVEELWLKIEPTNRTTLIDEYGNKGTVTDYQFER